MIKKKVGGFTLIELLVVIAIIAILASVVLVTFPGATKRAKDSRIISDIAQIRTAGTYICDTEGCDHVTCSHSDIAKLCEDIVAESAYENSTGSLIVAGSGGFCVSAHLNGSKPTSYYCADKEGNAGYTDSKCTATTCPTIQERP